MGLAASQARMLLLVARKSDLEYRGQMISQRRMLIAWDTEKVAKEYTDAMSNRTMKYIVTPANQQTGGTAVEVSMSSSNLRANSYGVVDSSGRQVLNAGDDSFEIESGLRTGKYHLVRLDADKNVTANAEKVDWRTNPEFNDKLDTTDDEAAKAKYEYESLKLQTQDKALEIELKNVDTQHQAVQTEVDAVKKVIDKNIESSFKTFG